MIEKNKKYTYEEIEKIFLEAQFKTLNELQKETLNELQKEWNEAGTDKDSTSDVLFSMQNVMVMAHLHGNFFEK